MTSSQGVLVKDQELFRYHECLVSVVEENILDNVPSWCENPWIRESNVENETNAKTTCNVQNEMNLTFRIEKATLIEEVCYWNKEQIGINEGMKICSL